jgi:hypothetical protein
MHRQHWRKPASYLQEVPEANPGFADGMGQSGADLQVTVDAVVIGPCEGFLCLWGS